MKQQVDSASNKVDSNIRSILKNKEEGMTEEERVQKNTHSNSQRSSKNVGYVASSISSEQSKVSTGSAYGLTGVDNINSRTKETRNQRSDEARDSDKREKMAYSPSRKRSTGITFHDPPAKLRSKQQPKSNAAYDKEILSERIQITISNLEVE